MTNRTGCRTLVLAFYLTTLLPGIVAAQVDSTAVEAHTEVDPKAALWRGLAVPGWGQAYNGQYVKMGVVIAAIGGLTANAVYLTDRHKLYRRAFQFRAFEERLAEGESNPAASFEPDYLKLLDEKGLTEISSSSIKPVRDKLRRNRDLSILGTGLVYALSVLDAYVSAHLANFDISDNLAIGVNPGLDPVFQPQASLSIIVGW